MIYVISDVGRVIERYLPFHLSAEIRLLFIWNGKPMRVNNLVRLSKGRMMGVDYNKEKSWVGSSIAYFHL